MIVSVLGVLVFGEEGLWVEIDVLWLDGFGVDVFGLVVGDEQLVCGYDD